MFYLGIAALCLAPSCGYLALVICLRRRGEREVALELAGHADSDR